MKPSLTSSLFNSCLSAIREMRGSDPALSLQVLDLLEKPQNLEVGYF